MKLLIVDRRIALVPLTSGEEAAAIVVRPSGLLDALVTLFGMLWEKARPFGGSRQERKSLDLSDEEWRLVGMLASGLKDETAARHLGLGVRTARRRIAAVMDRLGAVTRFQAGYLLGTRAGAATNRGHTGTPD
jgi:DNA-binding CsgD family transcriptional regulator